MATPSTLTVHRTRARVQSLWLPGPSGEEASRAAGIRRSRPGLGYQTLPSPALYSRSSNNVISCSVILL